MPEILLPAKVIRKSDKRIDEEVFIIKEADY